MLLARLVTVRHDYDPGEEYRPATGAAPGRGWLARLVAAISPRKRAG